MLNEWDESTHSPPEEDKLQNETSEETPIFRLLRQDFTTSREQGQIVKVAVANFLMVIATEFSHVIKWDMHSEDMQDLILSRKAEDKISGLFIDPTGQHVIVSCSSGNSFYLLAKFNKFVPLPKLKGINIISVAWDKKATESNTKKILLGSDVGVIYEFQVENEKEKLFKKIYELVEDPNEKVPICGLEFEMFAGQEKYLIMVATPTRHYQFIGSNSFESTFQLYTSPSTILPKFVELPGLLKLSRMSTYNVPDCLLKSCGWLTGAGVFFGSLLFGSQNPGDGVFSQTKFISCKEPPSSLVLTEFHILLLYSNRLVAVNQLSEITVQDLSLDLNAAGIVRDVATQCLFLYSDRNVYEISVDNEDRNVWKLYLAEGNFAAALEHAHNEEDANVIRESEADAFFAKGQYEYSAKLYASTSRSFEELTLKFIHQKADDALRTYLTAKLEILGSKKPSSQNVMLCTWLVEIHLDRLSSFKQKSGDDFDNCLMEFYQFLKSYFPILALNKNTIMDLITSHGRVDEYLYFAKLIGEFEKVILHHVQNGNYNDALDVLHVLDKPEDSQALFYKYAPILMRFEPASTVDLFIHSEFLDPCKIYPALMRFESGTGTELEHTLQAIRYIEFCLSKPKHSHQNSPLFNYLISLYSKLESDKSLLKFITKYSKIIDKKYALRVCHQEGKIRACVMLYAYMGLFEESVKLALTDECLPGGDVTLAKDIAKMSNSDEFSEFLVDKKKIWLIIAKHIIQKTMDVKNAIALIKEYSILNEGDEFNHVEAMKIEDILPFFPDSAHIGDFKDEICASLDEYNSHIDHLKKEMDESTQSANLIRKDIAQLRHRYGFVGAGQKCDICFKLALSGPFLVFPCSHVFHTDCVVAKLKDKHPALNLAALQEKCSEDCLFCGNYLIEQVTQPYVSIDLLDAELDSWAI